MGTYRDGYSGSRYNGSIVVTAAAPDSWYQQRCHWRDVAVIAHMVVVAMLGYCISTCQVLVMIAQMVFLVVEYCGCGRFFMCRPTLLCNGASAGVVIQKICTHSVATRVVEIDGNYDEISL